jgi:hypothetical protein
MVTRCVRLHNIGLINRCSSLIEFCLWGLDGILAFLELILIMELENLRLWVPVLSHCCDVINSDSLIYSEIALRTLP